MDDVATGSAPQHADGGKSPTLVPLALALQGPAAVAWALIEEAGNTEEQIDAVALLTLSLQKWFETRPDKNSPLYYCLSPRLMATTELYG